MRSPIPLALAGLALCTPPTAWGAPARADGPDRCLAFITTNLAKGGGNWHTYYRFADTKLKVAEGDVLSYRAYLDPRNPEPKGGIDADFEDGAKPLRDLGMKDELGVRAHGDGDLSAATGKWLARRIDISAAKGRTIVAWTINEEGDKDGRYTQFIDDVVVMHADGTKTVIYADGVPPARMLLGTDGYTREPVCVAIDSSRVKDGAPLDDAIRSAEKLGQRFKSLDHARSEIDVARKFVEIGTPGNTPRGNFIMLRGFVI